MCLYVFSGSKSICSIQHLLTGDPSSAKWTVLCELHLIQDMPKAKQYNDFTFYMASCLQKKATWKVGTLLERKYKLQVSDVAFNVNDAVKFLKKEFVITDVGIEVNVSAHYLEKIFGILDIKRPRTGRTACSAEIAQPDDSEVCDEEMAGRYRGAIGGFLYLSPDRPDCQWAIAHLARAMSRPTMKMFKHAIHLAEYMMNTRDACQVFRWTYPGRSCLDDRVLSRSETMVLH